MRKLLFVTGALVVVLAAIAFGRRRRRPSVIVASASEELAEPAAAPEDLVVFEADVLVELQGMGLSEIDPQPITQIAGEGIDLDTAPGVELLADEPQG